MATSKSRHREATAIQWDPNLEPLARRLITSNEVKIKSAIEVGRKAVDYFRGQCFAKWVLKNEETLRQEFPRCFDTPTHTLTAADVTSLGNSLIRNGFVYRASYKPLAKSPNVSAKEGAAALPAGGEHHPNDDLKTPKWPKRLAMAQQQTFDESSFYVVLYEPPNHWRIVLLALIIGSVLAVCMFPAWPMALKLASWYLSFTITVLIMGSVVLRLIAFVVLWFFGVDFWILPNLFVEELGVIDSFAPLYAFVHRGDSWLMVLSRVFLSMLLAGAFFQLSKTHSIGDVSRFASRQFLDVLDWGHQKLAAGPGNAAAIPTTDFGGPSTPLGGSVRRPRGRKRKTEGALADADLFESQRGVAEEPEDNSDEEDKEDYSCMQPCGFESYEVLKDECIFDCRCMKEVLSSHCYMKCNDATKKGLTEAQLDICHQEEKERAESKAVGTEEL